MDNYKSSSNIGINLYRSFYVFATSRNYEEASEKLHISSTAVCKNIKKLEYLLDTPLFYRENDGLKLTPDGEEYLKYIEQGLKMFDLGEKLILQKDDLANGEITIGCPSHITEFFLINAIKKVKKDYPTLKLNLYSGNSSLEMIQMLEDHKLDFIINTSTVETKYNNLVVEKIKDVENIFVYNQPLELNELNELEKLNLILNFENSSTIKNLKNLLLKYGVNISANSQCDITEVRIKSAKEGLGVSYVIKDSVQEELENKELFEVKLPVKLPSSSISIIYIKDQLTLINKKFIKEYIKK